MTSLRNTAKKNWADILFVLIFLASLILKISLVDKYRVNGDEGISVAAATSILKNGVPKLHGGIYPRDPLYHYLLAATIGIFGEGKLAVRSLSLLFSQLTLIIVYLFCKRYISISAALGTILFIFFSRSYNSQALNARMYTTAQFFCLGGVFAYYKGYFEKQDLFKLLAVISCLCAAFSHRISFPIIGSILIFHFISDFKTAIKDKYAYLLLFVLIFAYICTMKVNIFNAPTMKYKFADVIVGVSYSKLRTSIDTPQMLTLWRGLLNRFFPYSAYILLASIYFYFFRAKTRLYMLLWVVFMLPFLFFSVFTRTHFRFYWTTITFFAILVVTFLDYAIKTGISFSKETISSKDALKIKKLVLSSCCLVLLGTASFNLIGWNQISDRLTYPFIIREEFLWNSEPAFNFLSKHIKPSDVIITVDPPLTNFYKIPFQYSVRQKMVSKTSGKPFKVEREDYFGSTIIDSIEEFEEILQRYQNQNIWIFANEKYQWTISDKMHKWIEERFKLVFDKDYKKNKTFVFYLAKNT